MPPAGRARRDPPIAKQATADRTQVGFDSFDLLPELQRAVQAAGFTSPRPIQAQALPAALEGRDVLGLAQTGTGKTAAFALPILQRLQTGRPSNGRGAAPRALIVTPTRELSAQVLAECQLLGKYTPLKAQAVFGGVPVPRQIRDLKQCPDILVACPGRLLDLVGQRALSLDAVEVLVLDEADHMFDMGFLPDVRRILRALPKRRQNLLFSATMPREIRKLTEDVLVRPKVVEVEHGRRADTIEHALIRTDEGLKQNLLTRLLGAKDFRSAIVFTRTKARAKRLAQRLEKSGHRAVALQGNMSQNARDRAMSGFRGGSFDVLVATDIAARGIDVAGVSHVVNYDVPNTPEAYTHRIGRTGRAERSGKAFTFATRDDTAQVRAIEKHLGERIPESDLDRLAADGGRGLSAAKRRRGGPDRERGGLDRAPEGSGRPERGGDGRGQDEPRKGAHGGRRGSERTGGTRIGSGPKGRSGSAGRGDRPQRGIGRAGDAPEPRRRREEAAPARGRGPAARAKAGDERGAGQPFGAMIDG